MAYTHDNKKPVTLRNDPIDPDSSDWFYISYGGWLTSGETISSHSASSIVGGAVLTDSTLIGTVAVDGVDYANTYGVQLSVNSGVTQVELTHRVSTTKNIGVDVGRTNIDHTIIIPVKQL